MPLCSLVLCWWQSRQWTKSCPINPYCCFWKTFSTSSLPLISLQDGFPVLEILGGTYWTPQFALDVAVVLLPLVFGLMPEFVDKSSLPAWLTSPSALINLELLRVLRLRRVLRDKQSFLKFERALGIRTEIEDWQLQLARVLLSLFTLLSVSTGLIYTCEHGVNPCISNYFTALYFGLVTLSTVGKCVRREQMVVYEYSIC